MKQFWDWYKGRVWIPIYVGFLWIVLAFLKMPGNFDTNIPGLTIFKLKIIYVILGPVALLLSVVGVVCSVFNKKLENNVWLTAIASILLLAASGFTLFQILVRNPTNGFVIEMIFAVPLFIGCLGLVSAFSRMYSNSALRIFSAAMLLLNFAFITLLMHQYFFPRYDVGRPRRRRGSGFSWLPSSSDWTLP